MSGQGVAGAGRDGWSGIGTWAAMED